MRFGVCVSNIESYSDARTVAGLARAAEEAGWEALFVWDHLAFVWGKPSADPWIVLTACALETSSILLGTAVTPVPRRRVQDLAQTVATLDRLSGGRVVFGAGLGGNRGEFERFGEDFSRPRRLELLDKGLGELRRWWNGEESFGVTLRPLPAGPVPIWVGGRRAESVAVAARFDGWLADSADLNGMILSPDEISSKGREVGGEIAVTGFSDRASVADYESAGATWWLESLHDRRGTPDEMLQLVRAGPPSA